jgi:CRP/FNR family transcriptional regulator
MSTGAAALYKETKPLEDPLAYLPCSNMLEFRKGQTIYNQTQPSSGIHLIIDGTVKVCRTANDGRQVVVDIYQPDEFFGESGLLGQTQGEESAIALKSTRLMTWTTEEIENLSTKRPKLAIALVQLLVQRSMDFGARVESFSTDPVQRRLARSLVRFSDRFGHQEEDGSMQINAFTHELLSQHVGTSREIVTHFMNQFRRDGYLRYSRKNIFVYRESLRDWLRQGAAAAA